jgi:hypothetical protein
MKKIPLTVFLCASKDCNKAWRHICHGSPGKWLKHQLHAAGLPYKLNIIKTGCMDRCDEAACLCAVHDRHACLETEIHSSHDIDRILTALRVCVENASLSDAQDKRHERPLSTG